MELNELLDAAIDRAYQNCIKHCRGKVTTVYTDSKYADVDIDGKSLKFPNKTARELAVGEEVEIRYWNTIASGWIAMITSN